MYSTTLTDWPTAEQTLRKLAAWIKPRTLAGKPVTLAVTEDKRSLPQNSRMWAMLTDVSRQVDWYGQRMSPEDWKHVFSASIKKQRAVPGLDGGFVVLGVSTSNMSKEELSALIDLISAFGSERGVIWSKTHEEH